MTALVRRIDAAKTVLQSQMREALGRLFLPGGAVKKTWHFDSADGKRSFCH
jgi:predicted dithiol-disulfide oxidoreductase (DUF899 family)